MTTSTNKPEEQPEECDGCNYLTTNLTAYERRDHEGWKWLCELCGNTMAGTAVDHMVENGNVLSALSYIGNVIIGKLEERRHR